MVATKGRRVLVEASDGVVRDCHLAGHRAVIGDRVRVAPMGDDGGRLVEVADRARALVRSDPKGRSQVIAAHLGGLVVVTACDQPAYRPGLVDRYEVAAWVAGVPMVLVVGKTDLGEPAEVTADLKERAERGLDILRIAARPGAGEPVGVERVRAFLDAHAEEGPWALVGHSGVGKTSLVAALLPDEDVGPIGEISDYWEAGRHTTTGSRIFRLPGSRAELADSPGIRTFLPDGLAPADVRDGFPGLGPLGCRYRDCLHRPGEDGCVAEAVVPAERLVRYRRLLQEVTQVDARRRP